jgi:hypothetical protein
MLLACRNFWILPLDLREFLPQTLENQIGLNRLRNDYVKLG